MDKGPMRARVDVRIPIYGLGWPGSGVADAEFPASTGSKEKFDENVKNQCISWLSDQLLI